MLCWGGFAGILLGVLQLLAIPVLSLFSPLPEVQEAAKLPSMIGAALQIVNGIGFGGKDLE